ncbi:MerR family transcriptional regulator [Pseudovibrio ascidiaceicola]|uniref:MerR family transcriptional regulator n=1 Tax=Pseudovibrio ascidiaceicola TaxID=285279 RepID=UPI003D36765A
MDVITKTRGYLIGQLSNLTSVNIETIRYYERIGIMPKPDRTSGGNRLYNDRQLKRLVFIRRSRELGFSIEEIRALLKMVDGSNFSCAEVHAMTTEHLTSVKKKIASLKKLEKVLSSMATQCSRGDVPECPVVDALFEG